MITGSRRWKVAVCGTGFGIFYAEAAMRNTEAFELTGIVARGSERSVKCASHYNVPLYNCVEDLPADTDLVCVVVRSSMLGGNGTDMALACLERGMSVVLEQPVHPDDLKKLFQSAIRHKCAYMTGNLYANLTEIRRFLQVAQKLTAQGSRLEYIQCGSSVQAFYPFVEILGKLVPGGELKIAAVDEQRGSFRQIMGVLGGIPVSFRFNNEMDPKDPDNHMQILHTFSCCYDTGRLELVDSRGPLLWYPRLRIPWSVFRNGCFPSSAQDYPEFVRNSNVVMLTPHQRVFEKPYYQALEQDWVSSIGMDQLRIRSLKEDRSKLIVRAQTEQKNARIWNELSRKFGYAVLNEDLAQTPIVKLDLKQEAILPEELE